VYTKPWLILANTTIAQRYEKFTFGSRVTRNIKPSMVWERMENVTRVSNPLGVVEVSFVDGTEKTLDAKAVCIGRVPSSLARGMTCAVSIAPSYAPA